MASGSGKDIYGEQDYGLANRVANEALKSLDKAADKADINGVSDGRAKGDDMSPRGPGSVDKD